MSVFQWMSGEADRVPDPAKLKRGERFHLPCNKIIRTVINAATLRFRHRVRPSQWPGMRECRSGPTTLAGSFDIDCMQHILVISLL
jgi:hypothetical protein